MSGCIHCGTIDSEAGPGAKLIAFANFVSSDIVVISYIVYLGKSESKGLKRVFSLAFCY